MHAMPCCVLVGAVTAGANCCTVCHLLSMDQLRSQVKQEDVKVKEGWSTLAVCCVRVGSPLGSPHRVKAHVTDRRSQRLWWKVRGLEGPPR